MFLVARTWAWGIPVIFIFDSKESSSRRSIPNNLTPEVLYAALRGEVPKVKQAVPWHDPAGAENYLRKLQLELNAVGAFSSAGIAGTNNKVTIELQGVNKQQEVDVTDSQPVEPAGTNKVTVIR